MLIIIPRKKREKDLTLANRCKENVLKEKLISRRVLLQYLRLEPSFFFSRYGISVIFFLTFFPFLGHSQVVHSEKLNPRDVARLSLDQLLDLEITSVSRKSEKLSQAAAAIYVLTREDIHRSGATTIPDLLRRVPGLNVGRINASAWAVTSRGFNGISANKLLVLIDGRNVYDPSFSGVNWDAQDVFMEDIDRIEIIRGPGAALWGANAVNGVINITTRKAEETQDGFLTAGVGNEERVFGGVRYGLSLTDRIHLRIYGKAFQRDDLVDVHGNNAGDAWEGVQGGMRLDWEPLPTDSFTLQGDIYHRDGNQIDFIPSLDPPFENKVSGEKKLKGGNVLARWSHTFSEISDLTIQIYYDRVERNIEFFDGMYQTLDIDFQNGLRFTDYHEVVWGLGYRHVEDDFNNTFTVSFNPSKRKTDLFSAFLQDDIILVEDRLRLTLGAKFEYNDYTGFEIQPSIRLLMAPNDRQSLWGSISRAVRTPSRAEHDVEFVGNVQPVPSNPLDPNSPPIISVVRRQGKDDVESEEVLSFELGYRTQLHAHISLDFASFFNVYENLLTLERGDSFLQTSPSPSRIIIPIVGGNKMSGDGYGFEALINWMALEWWRFETAYTFHSFNLNPDKDSNDETSETLADTTPHHQVFFRSSMNLMKNIEMDIGLRYVDNVSGRDIPRYTSVDVRLAWRPAPGIEIAIVGQNILDKSQPEFEPDPVRSLRTENQRSVYGRISVSF